jgi:hypothetical protein
MRRNAMKKKLEQNFVIADLVYAGLQAGMRTTDTAWR